MGFVPADRTAQILCQYTQDNEPCENVYWAQGTAQYTHAMCHSLADNIATWMTTVGLPLQATNVAAQRCVVTAWDVANGPQYVSEGGMPADGTATGYALPNNVSIAISHRTDLRGRSYRGRTYWIGLSEAHVSDNTINTGYIPSLVHAMTVLQDAINTVNNGKLVVASFRSGGAPRASAVLTEVTSFPIDQYIDSMRRRLPGHNRHR